MQLVVDYSRSHIRDVCLSSIVLSCVFSTVEPIHKMDSTCTCLCLFAALALSVACAMPVPPVTPIFKSQFKEVLADSDLLAKLENFIAEDTAQILDYLKQDFVLQCEDYCSFIYPTHTYPVVDNSLACKAGCRLEQAGKGFSKCKLECSNLYSSEDERYACSVGCNASQSTSSNSQDDSEVKFVTIRKVITTKLEVPFHTLGESIKGLLWGVDPEEATDQSETGVKTESKYMIVKNGQEVILFDGYSDTDTLKVLEEFFPKGSQELKDTSHYSPSFVYISKSMCTVYHKLLVSKPLMVIGTILLLVSLPIICLSIIADIRTSTKQDESIKDTPPHDVKVPLSPPTSTDISKNVYSEFVPKELPIEMPVTIVLHPNL